MGWAVGRGRHGTLALPNPTRRQQRLSWLDQDLRQRRRELLRRQWKVLLLPAAAFTVAAVGPAVAVRDQPFLLGAVVGCLLGAMAVGGTLFVNLLDGTLLARIGRMFEREVGQELRETKGVYGVVSDVSFQGCNVDHVVLCPRGILAVEVKGMLGRRRELAHMHGRSDKLAQTHAGARKIESLLRSGGLGGAPVSPVLVLAGPGVPVMDGTESEEGVRLLAFRDSAAWRPQLATTDLPVVLDEATARRAAEVLLEHTRKRTDYERDQASARRAPAAVPGQRRGAATSSGRRRARV